MKHIQKGREPKSLERHRLSAAATYDNYAEKDDLRAALLEEQGFLCCYWDSAGKYREYCQVAVYYLKKKLALRSRG